MILYSGITTSGTVVIQLEGSQAVKSFWFGAGSSTWDKKSPRAAVRGLFICCLGSVIFYLW